MHQVRDHFAICSTRMSIDICLFRKGLGRRLINELYLASKWSDMARKRVKDGLDAHSSSLPTPDLDHFVVQRIGRFFPITTSQGFENATHCLHPYSLRSKKLTSTKCTAFMSLRPRT
jgi:hypothetical protein